MTGLHGGHTPARDNIPHYHTYLQDADITIAEVLRPAGYRCGGIGKWSLGDAGTVGRATNQGFDSWFGYLNQDHAHYYYAEYLDDDEGKMVRLIDELGLATKTLIIVTSDHGPWGGMPRLFNSAGPLRGEKRQLYEGGIRVPFIARRPGHVPAGKVSDEVIAFWDMLPTFAELAGAEAPADVDGISIAAALKGEEVEASHEYLYWDYGHNRQTYHQAIRMGDWKGVRHGQGGRVELYDLSEDLAEAHDVAVVPRWGRHLPPMWPRCRMPRSPRARWGSTR